MNDLEYRIVGLHPSAIKMKTLLKIRPGYIILVFILAFFFGKNLFPTDGNLIGGIDVAEYFFWHAQFIKDQFLSGSIPLWNPYYYCGHPFLANPQTFVFYPATLLFIALPMSWAFNLDTVLHIYLAAMGIYCFVFIITLSRSAGLASAIVCSLSGYFMVNIFAGHLTMLHTAALLPWIFYFTEKAFKTKRTSYLTISGLILGLQILGGEPQNNYYTAFFITLYFFIRYFSTIRPLSSEQFFRFGIYYFLIPVTAFGVSAIQILPSLELMSLCDRAKSTYEFATFISFPPLNFFTFLVPNPTTSHINTNREFAGYLGILPIILAGIGGGLSKQRRYTLCFGIMIFIATTIMLGHYTPIYQLFYKWLPGISTFRIPARCIVILVFSIAVLAGFGVRQLCETPLSRKQHIVVIACLAIILLCLFGGAKVFQIPLTSKEMLFAICFTIGAFVILNLIRFLKNGHIVAGLLIIALFIDLCLIYSPIIPKLNQFHLLQKREYELVFEKDPGFYRVALPKGTPRGMKFHYYDINGYSPISLDHYFKFIHYMADLPRHTKLKQTLNHQLFRPDSVFSSKILGIKYAIAKNQSEYEIYTSHRVMPRAVLVRDAVILPNLEEHLKYIKRPYFFYPERTVLLESVPDDHKLPAFKSDSESIKDDIVSIRQYEPNRITLSSVSDSNTYLVLSELFYPGWYAYVDGKEVPILRADYLLRAIPLKSGRHDIVFVYRPMSFFLGAAISTFTLLLLGGIYLVYRMKKDE